MRSTSCILAVTASLAAILAGKAALAQSDAERLEALRGCLGIESDAARLLCLESILAAESRETAAAEPVSTDSDAINAVPPATPAVIQPEAAPAAATPVSTVAESAEAAISVEDDASQSRRDRDDAFAVDETETLVIVETGALRRGNATFLTEDGRLFVQTSGPTSRNLPPVPFEATLEDGAFGSVFLLAPSARLRIRVAERTD